MSNQTFNEEDSLSLATFVFQPLSKTDVNTQECINHRKKDNKKVKEEVVGNKEEIRVVSKKKSSKTDMKQVHEMNYSGYEESTKEVKNYQQDESNKEQEGSNKMSSDKEFGIGLDVGTGFLVSASFNDSNISYRSVRDCFIEIPKETFNPRILSSDVKYIELGGAIYLVGEAALDFARLKNAPALRPLSNGVVNPKERASAPILRELFGHVLRPIIKKENEKLVFSIPGPQIGNDKFDTNFHTQSIQGLCRSFKLDAIPLNEAYAVAISELDRVDNVSALSFSFGAGLVNACFTYNGLNLFEFSISKSGDYIDQRAAQATGVSESIISNIKEKKLNLDADEWSVSPEERALIYEYRWVIQNTLNQVKNAFKASDSIKVFDPIPVIVSGGTSLPNGFIKMFESELNTAGMPFDVSKVIVAKNQLKSVAKGCLIYANSLEEE